MPSLVGSEMCIRDRIIRDKTSILCQLQDCRGNYYEQIFELAKLIGPNQRQTCQANSYVLHAYQDEKKFTYICLTDFKYKQRLAYLFLNKVKAAFETQYPPEIRETGINNSFQKDFEYSLRHEMDNFNSVDADKLTRLQYELDQIQNIMTKNIDTMLKNQQRLEVLVDKADRIQVNAGKFSKNAKIFKDIIKCNKWWLWVLIVLLILIIAWVVGIIFCGFKFNKC
eukprot:TRINITY_DN6815_c0_g1_i4.p2 TRINITY_DN6815_c0_g1~~TRINITY_DN6815_c0_g1_i4.p2  ORF type:complete len:225 (+),score=34.52 TRINITY_DN6815_c0_g1_i4:96-770(+)